MTSGALIEQAKGVLIFRYSIDADTALAVLELWSSERSVELTTLSYVLLHDICQGRHPGHADPTLLRWLEDKLRRDCPEVHLEVGGPSQPVVVAIDQSYSSIDLVVAAAKQAARFGVPLELRVEEDTLTNAVGPSRVHLLQRMDLAVELARAVEPGLDVRLPACELFGPSTTK
jgi:non-ribosomal peptide synthetase component F